jgi:phage shock protein PspC (stress-responsive transcriptional regulator)
MKSAISVEIDGTTFICDERAYAALRAYLDRAGARLGTHPDRAEVIAGLERSIAARLRLRAETPGGAALDEAAMLAALKEVGRVDGPMLDNSAASGRRADGPARDESASSAEGGYGERRTRTLYRLREGNWFAGVCVGIAAYAGIDAVVVRLIFILMAFFSGGIVVLVYLVLMFVMPIAVTEDEIADAHRGPRRI